MQPPGGSECCRPGRWSRCGSGYSCPAITRWQIPLDLTGEGSSTCDRYPPATVQGSLEHSPTTGCVGSQLRAGEIFAPCEPLGRCYLPQRVPESWRFFQAVQTTCRFLARSGEFSLQSVSLLVTGSSPRPSRFSKGKNQNNLPKRVKTWRKISVMLCEGGWHSSASLLASALAQFPQLWPDQMSTEARGDFPVISMDVWLC